jgi:hypothetical protein
MHLDPRVSGLKFPKQPVQGPIVDFYLSLNQAAPGTAFDFARNQFHGLYAGYS